MKKIIPLFISIFFASNSYSQKDYSVVYQSDSIIKKGVALHDSKKYPEAIKEYEKINITDPEYLKAQSEIAFTLSETDKKEELKKLFEKLYQSGKMKDYPELYVRYANFLSDQDDLVNSEKIFKESEQQLGNNSRYLYNYAILLIKAKRNQESVAILEKLITVNPNYSSAHYLLGLLAFENGNTTEGTLAFITYLVASPNGRFANDAITVLNLKLGENYLNKGNLIFSKSGDNFEEMNDILRNQFPLNKNYKLKSEIDYVFTRQVQAVVEYAAEHKIGNGFFETTYIPWMKEAVKNNQVEALGYYSLISLENTLGKKLTAQKKKIQSFDTNFLPIFWDKMTLKNIDFYGKNENVTIIYKNNLPYLIGQLIDNKKEGKFLYLDEYGNKNGDLLFKNNELDGLQKYYNASGNLIEEKSFKNGIIDGVKKTYFDNGQLGSIENYTDGKLNGLITTYYANGGKLGEINFVNDEKDGKTTFYFANGAIKTEATYSKNKINGSILEYNEAGDLITTAKYKDGLFDGEYKQYFDGKKVKAEGVYENGKIKDSYKKYYASGNIQSSIEYENGKIKKETAYLANGKLDQESFYNNEEDMERIVLYDSFGEKFFEEKFKNGDLKSGLQYLKNSDKPKEINLSKKTFEIYNLDGSKLITGEFEKGKKSGDWTYYYNNGNIKNKQKFVAGLLNGVEYDYKKNGDLSVICNYKDGELNGIYESYNNGVISNITYYLKDKKNGPSTSYFDENKISKQKFYNDGDLFNVSYSYTIDGNLKTKTSYTNDEFTDNTIYNSKGEIENTFSYSNKTGSYTIPYNGGITKSSFILKNGQYNGKYELKDKFNTQIVEANYINGALNGTYKDYTPSGALYSETNYYAGLRNGNQKYNDLAGNLKLTYSTVFGNNTGTTIRYNINKTKLSEYTEIENITEGPYKWYNIKGENVATIVFENDIPIYYLRLDKQGELKEKIEIVNQTAEIVSNYPNGKKAFYLKLVKGSKEGTMGIFSQEGRPEYATNYIKDNIEGERMEYYSSGKIYKKEHFKNDDYDGLVEYFSEDGKKLITAEYKNDDLDGKCQIFENGVLKTTKIYKADELVEIIK